jgi:hypothetical protein
VEYWNDGLRAMKTKAWVFPTIPSFHHSFLSSFDTHYSNVPTIHYSDSPKDYAHGEWWSPESQETSGASSLILE